MTGGSSSVWVECVAFASILTEFFEDVKRVTWNHFFLLHCGMGHGKDNEQLAATAQKPFLEKLKTSKHKGVRPDCFIFTAFTLGQNPC